MAAPANPIPTTRNPSAPQTHCLQNRETILNNYQTIRSQTESLAKPLAPEDQTIQTMPDVSPTKWHLAHTSWFFETFLLKPLAKNYEPPNPAYNRLFNSYYQQIGEQYPRPQRGLLSRPTVREIADYRAHINRAMTNLIKTLNEKDWRRAAPRIILGLHHEQQHQELILTDIKHVLAQNPLAPAAYAQDETPEPQNAPPNQDWLSFEGGETTIGADAADAADNPNAAFAYDHFAYDNECPAHKTHLPPFRLTTRLITNGEYLAFMEEGGYERPEFWLSDGWALCQKEKWRAPFYWRKNEKNGAAKNAVYEEFTLGGARALHEAAPVCHVNYYEASAYASWAGKRLPREEELEAAAANMPIQGHFGLRLHKDEVVAPHPKAAPRQPGMTQLYGDLWEWTMSPYMPYRGFQAARGALGEYNGKFMCNQFVLKGGSCATPRGHLRASYRNFFPPDARWQFSGIRLAEDG